MLKALIIEDEVDARSLLTKIIKDYCANLEVVASAGNIREGVDLIENHTPDIVFLDIQLEDGSAFQLLDKLTQRKFKIIFTTAYAEFALKAFRYEAIDYILKPYSPSQVVEAVSRVKDQNISSELFTNLQSIVENSISGNQKKINIATADGLHFFTPDNIIRAEADRSYSCIYLLSGEKKLISKPLKELEEILPKKYFFRTHASHLINLTHVKKLSNEDGGYILLTDGSQVPLARRRKVEFIEQLELT